MVSPHPTYRRGRPARGFTLAELMVSATLLVAIMGIVVPLTVRSGWLWQDAHRMQLAVDELTNQLERLVSLPPEQREIEIANLQMPPHLKAALPHAVIRAQTIHDTSGSRIVMSLRMNAESAAKSRVSAPIILVAWLDPMPDATSDAEPGEASS